MADSSLQYLEELMSTRLGVKRNGEVVAAETRMGPDGKEYYDIQVSFATSKCYSAGRMPLGLLVRS